MIETNLHNFRNTPISLLIFCDKSGYLIDVTRYSVYFLCLPAVILEGQILALTCECMHTYEFTNKISKRTFVMPLSKAHIVGEVAEQNGYPKNQSFEIIGVKS